MASSPKPLATTCKKKKYFNGEEVVPLILTILKTNSNWTFLLKYQTQMIKINYVKKYYILYVLNITTEDI